MGWQPSKLTREQMEERRLEGARLLRLGKTTQAEIARELGVSRATVSDWAKRLAADGPGAVRRRQPTGRAPKLSVAQQRTLLHLLDRGALAAGFPEARWTGRRVVTLIRRVFGVGYHERYVPRLLRKLGWSRQVPLPRAQERDEDLVRAWLARDWPRIKKGTAARRADRLLR